MRILFFGDIMGKPGRAALTRRMPELRKAYEPDMIIANGENASGGVGLTPEEMRELFAIGISVLTSGNHIWKHRSIYNTLDKEPNLIRPANYPKGTPGKGITVFKPEGKPAVAVMNLLGRTYLDALECPFATAQNLLKQLREEHPDVRIVFVDFHAEATSEKKALGWYLDGKVSAVIGTHTHVQTADTSILPHGTAYMTDAGMCGVEASCLGMDHNVIIDRFLTRLPQRFKLAKGTAGINGVCIDIDEETGKATHIELIRE